MFPVKYVITNVSCVSCSGGRITSVSCKGRRITSIFCISHIVGRFTNISFVSKQSSTCVGIFWSTQFILVLTVLHYLALHKQYFFSSKGKISMCMTARCHLFTFSDETGTCCTDDINNY